jgi:hypothetical protein
MNTISLEDGVLVVKFSCEAQFEWNEQENILQIKGDKLRIYFYFCPLIFLSSGKKISTLEEYDLADLLKSLYPDEYEPEPEDMILLQEDADIIFRDKDSKEEYVLMRIRFIAP